MSRFSSLLLLLLLLSRAPLPAAELRLSLAEAPLYAEKHNPSLAAARWRIAEARGRWHQAGRLQNPQLELQAAREVRSPEGSLTATLEQRFPLTARLRLEKAVSLAELQAAEAEIRNVARRLRAETGAAAVRLLAWHSLQEVRERQLQFNGELLRFTRGRVEAGEAARVDATLLELEAQQLRAEGLLQQAERAGLEGDLRTLLGLPASVQPILFGPLPEPAPLPAGPADPETRPDWQAARRSAEAARQQAALARAERWPDLGAGLYAAREREEDAPEGYRTEHFLGLRLSVPLPLWNRNQGRREETAAAAARTRQEVAALGLQIQAEAEAARAAMAAFRSLVQALGAEALPQARAVEAQLRTGYGEGQGSMTDILRARERRLTLERQRVEAVRDFHLARLRYAAALGQ